MKTQYFIIIIYICDCWSLWVGPWRGGCGPGGCAALGGCGPGGLRPPGVLRSAGGLSTLTWAMTEKPGGFDDWGERPA